jgi:L-glutamine-phosphate cytidylyltransferase
MVALVLAAGRGSRLGNYTDNIPKSLLPLNKEGNTLLDFNLDILENQLNVDKIIIVTGYESEQIEKVAKNYSKTQIIYNPFWNHCNVLGSMYMALDLLDDDFLFLHADTLMESGAWIELSKAKKGDMILPYDDKTCGEEEMKIIIENGKVTKISKEFDAKLASGEFVGIALFRKNTISYFKDIATKLFKEGNLKHYMESVVQYAINHNDKDIIPLNISQYSFVEVDFEEDYFKAKQVFG